MPRRRLPPRLYQRSDGVWVIRDGKRSRGTGSRSPCGSEAPGDARRALAEYLDTADREAPTGPRQPDQITVDEILALYADHVADTVRSPQTLAYSIKALLPFWAEMTCDAVKGSTCRKYAKERDAAPSTTRRELGVLQAALNLAHREGALIHPIAVTLPPASPPRDRWLTREEVRKLLRASPPHLRRFIIVAVLTGTRTSAVLDLRWTPSLTSGWVDLDRGVVHRGPGTANKRRGSVRATRALHRLLVRWSKQGGSHVVMHRGQPIRSVKTAMREAATRAKIENVTPHALKHTAVTWAFQKGMTLEDAADYFSTTAAVLERVYRKQSPNYQSRAVEAMERR